MDSRFEIAIFLGMEKLLPCRSLKIRRIHVRFNKLIKGNHSKGKRRLQILKINIQNFRSMVNVSDIQINQ